MTALTRRWNIPCCGKGSDSVDADGKAKEEQEVGAELQTLNERVDGRLEALQQAREEAAPLANARRPLAQFLHYARNWTLFYAILFVLLVAFCSSATYVAGVMKQVSAICIVVISGLGKAALKEGWNAIKQRRKPHMRYAAWYGLCLSLFLQSSVASRFYARIFHWSKPCHKFEDTLRYLRHSSTLSANHSFVDQNRPLQALGLGDHQMYQLKDALQAHFDRFSRNETEPFPFVKKINLIGNLFTAKGAAFLIEALGHQYSYTETLLLSHNPNLGDGTAAKLASFIEQKEPPALNWLSFSDTAVTAKGLERLYSAMGSRPFSYLGTDYTDKYFFQRVPWIFTPSPVKASISHLHKAKGLQELGLTGNKLGDNEMKTLALNVLQTNITSLNLIHNWIGPQGDEHILPLINQLKELQLGINARIGDAGAILLAKALTNQNATVENLSIFNSRVGQEGAEALLDIFPGNTKLKFLSLGHVGPVISRDAIRKETLQALKEATEANWRRA